MYFEAWVCEARRSVRSGYEAQWGNIKGESMTKDEIKAALKELPASERREIGKYILDLERDRFQTELPEDLKKLATVIQNETEKMRQTVVDELEQFKKWMERR